MTNISTDIGRQALATVEARAAQYPYPANDTGNYRYRSKMPELADDASIQDALYMYHYGQANYDPNAAIASDSVEGWLGNLQHQIDDLFLRPPAGGEVKSTEPITVGGEPIPDGYVWVDSSDSSTYLPAYPSVIYSSTQPTGLTGADAGTLWIDSDATLDVLNTADYQPITKYISNAPASPVTGQFWVDSDNGVLYLYNGSSWIEVTAASTNGFLLMGA